MAKLPRILLALIFAGCSATGIRITPRIAPTSTEQPAAPDGRLDCLDEFRVVGIYDYFGQPIIGEESPIAAIRAAATDLDPDDVIFHVSDEKYSVVVDEREIHIYEVAETAGGFYIRSSVHCSE